MTNVEVLRRLRNMIVNLSRQNMKDSVILFSVLHDLEGIVEKKRCFLPRCSSHKEITR
jgi:hypothetical protein